MARVHGTDWKALGLEFLDRPHRGSPGLDQEVNYYKRYLEWAAGGTPQPIAEAVLDWIEANRPATDQAPLALCWGDSRIGNQIFRDFECRAVLDWEMVTLGDPVMDLGWWLFLDRHHSEGLGVPRLPGFPSREATVTRWEELTGRRAEHLDFYETFAGFRFAVIMVRLAGLLDTYELLPPDSDMATNNVVTQLLAKMLALPPPGELTIQW
jgi:aminoglycoside phosphotransferase (APT) family kinase protein